MTAIDESPARPDRRRDLPGYVSVPLVTLVLAPALALSIGVLVAESSTAYPQICAAAAAGNGCEETVFSVFATHARIFFAGWLLLWALPWWRGLRPFRILAAVLVGGVLFAAPLRLVSGSSVEGLVSLPEWEGRIQGDTRTASELSHLGTAFTLTAVLILAVPAAAFLRFAVHRRWGAAALCAGLAIGLVLPAYQLARLGYHANDRARQMRVVPDPHPPCQVHSGSHDVCPGG